MIIISVGNTLINLRVISTGARTKEGVINRQVTVPVRGLLTVVTKIAAARSLKNRSA